MFPQSLRPGKILGLNISLGKLSVCCFSLVKSLMTNQRETTVGTKEVVPGVRAIVSDSVPATLIIQSRARGAARDRVIVAGENADLTTPPTSLVVFFCAVIFNSRERHRAESALSAKFIPDEALRPGQEASSNPILTLNDRPQREMIL